MRVKYSPIRSAELNSISWADRKTQIIGDRRSKYYPSRNIEHILDFENKPHLLSLERINCEPVRIVDDRSRDRDCSRPPPRTRTGAD